jgi:enamine deaminase RidA (YjgF/YER057c/UK114 family)
METESRSGDMVGIMRRDLGRLAAAAAGGMVSASGAKGAPGMDIARYGITQPTGGIPIISLATVHNGIAYLCGVTADPQRLGDVRDQTRQVLERIDRLLARAGTDKSKLLTAQVWLADMSLFAAHNEAWNAWVDAAGPPARACLQSPALWQPGMLVEIMVTAAVAPR